MTTTAEMTTTVEMTTAAEMTNDTELLRRLGDCLVEPPSQG